MAIAAGSSRDEHTPLAPVDGSPVGRQSDPGSLAELLAQSAKGDEAAFASLYDQTARRVFGLVLRILRDQAIPEEVTQEAYLQVWQTAARYDQAKGSAASWIMTVAHRRAVDRVRSTEAVRRRDTAYHHESLTVEHDVTAASAEASMEARRVRLALESLSPVQRHVLELAYFRGHTHTEIAVIVGIPVGTAKTRIRDGLFRLRGLMNEAV